MNRETLISLVIFGCILLIGLIVLSIYLFPHFTACLLGLCLIALLFVISEKWITHDAAEFENRFWTLFAFVLAFSVVFSYDSPLCVSSDHAGLGWIIIALSTYFAHIYNRHLHRVVLMRVPNINRTLSADLIDERKLNYKKKLTELRSCLTSIDNPWMSSFFINIFLLPHVVFREKQIISIFSDTTTDELNLLVSNIELALFFYKVKDHNMARQFSRSKLLNLLSETRISELNVSSKVMLLDGLQKLKLSAHPMSEEYVKNIIMSTQGDELSALKSLTDSKGDVNSMHKLIYEDIRNVNIRKTILDHIKKWGNIQATYKTMGAININKKRNQFAWRKVLSDVDDTLMCSGGSYPAGVDKSYPKKSIYPGIIAFYRELDIGTTGSKIWQKGNLVFLSARPHLYKDVSEATSYKKFKMLQEKHNLHTSPTLLAGAVDSGTIFIAKNTMEPLAQTKCRKFKEYLLLYPEYDCVFIGDNGQGDVRTAEMLFEPLRKESIPVSSPSKCKDKSDIASKELLQKKVELLAQQEHRELGKKLERTYIHKVIPLDQTHALESSTKSLYNKHICYFNTYIDAAIDAYNHKLISIEGLRNIMKESVSDFELIHLELLTLNEKKDVQSKEKIKIKKITKSSFISSIFGIFSKSSNSSSISEECDINNDEYSIDDNFNELSKQINIKKIDEKKNDLKNERGEQKRDIRLLSLNNAIENGNIILINNNLNPIPIIQRYINRYEVGKGVNTKYGSGIINSFNGNNGIYEIHLQWDNQSSPIKAYLQENGILL
jgi:hypothetical protein